MCLQINGQKPEYDSVGQIVKSKLRIVACQCQCLKLQYFWSCVYSYLPIKVILTRIIFLRSLCTVWLKQLLWLKYWILNITIANYPAFLVRQKYKIQDQGPNDVLSPSTVPVRIGWFWCLRVIRCTWGKLARFWTWKIGTIVDFWQRKFNYI